MKGACMLHWSIPTQPYFTIRVVHPIILTSSFKSVSKETSGELYRVISYFNIREGHEDVQASLFSCFSCYLASCHQPAGGMHRCCLQLRTIMTSCRIVLFNFHIVLFQILFALYIVSKIIRSIFFLEPTSRSILSLLLQRDTLLPF
jgi:hypothetical protein